MDAEEDVQDFRQLRPGLDSPQAVVLFLRSLKFSAIAWSGSSKDKYLGQAGLFTITPKSTFPTVVSNLVYAPTLFVYSPTISKSISYVRSSK